MSGKPYKKEIKALTAFDLVWIVGILEGEGSFHVNHDSHGITIAVAMSDEDVIAKLASFFDRPYRSYEPGPPRQRMSRVEITGQQAVLLMEMARPRMSTRRGEQMDRCLASAALRASPADKARKMVARNKLQPVSYTHLTLPTICSV